jgi:hypothetical protein
LRPAYDNFSVGDDEDTELNEYLSEHGEHPKVLLDLVKRIKKQEQYFDY